MKQAVMAAVAVFFFIFLSYIFDLTLAITIIIWTITGGTVLFGLIMLWFWILTTRENYRITRAKRLQAEREAEVKVVTAGSQVFIADLNHDAQWRAAHLDPRFYANSKDTFDDPSDIEVESWREFNRPKTIEKVIQPKQLLSGEKAETLYNLLDNYPHIMLIGGTNSGKSTTMCHCIEHRLPGKVVWLSTHAKLDADRGTIHPKAICISDPQEIGKALNDIFEVYKKRKEKADNYQHIILALDEWPEIVDEVENAGNVLRRLSRGGRKCAISLILACHGATVADLDIRGRSSVKMDFAEVYLNPKLTRQNKAIWQPFNKGSQVEIALPGLYYNNETERIKEAIKRLGPQASYRQISEAVWGSGKFGSYYNEKIERVK